MALVLTFEKKINDHAKEGEPFPRILRATLTLGEKGMNEKATGETTFPPTHNRECLEIRAMSIRLKRRLGPK